MREVEADPSVTERPARPKHQHHLDVIRAVAALYVAVYHALLVLWPNDGPRPPWYLWWADFGHVGVSVFIVVSGYSLALGMANRSQTSVSGYWRFMLKRARRLLPPYWVALAVSIVLLELAPQQVATGPTGGAGEFAKGPVPFRSMVAFFLLLHDVVDVPSPNSPLWSIAVEWHLYFLFPLLVLLGARFGMARMAAGATLVGVALHYALSGTSAIGTTPHFLGLFAFGIVAAYATAQRPFAGGGRPSWARGLGWGTFTAGVLSFGVLARAEVGADLLTGVLVAVALWMLGSTVTGDGPRTRTGRALGAVGLMSYSLYLTHSPVEKVVWKLGASRLDLTPVPALGVLLAGALPVALLAAFVLYRLVERPAHEWSRAVPRR